MKRRTISVIRVFATPGERRRGRLVAGNLVVACALGRGGTSRAKREGDGATPVGAFGLGRAYFRSDHIRRPPTLLALRALKRDDAWCDDPADRLYNRPIKRVGPPGEEALWRADRLYDVVVEIAYNVRPAVRGRGSAIFLHLARPGFEPTAGCIAVAPTAFRRLLAIIGPRTRIVIA